MVPRQLDSGSYLWLVEMLAMLVEYIFSRATRSVYPEEGLGLFSLALQ